MLLELAYYVLAFLLEALIDGVFELIFAFGWESLGHAIGLRKPSSFLFASIGVVILGGLSGAVSVLLVGESVFPRQRFQGTSLVVAPIFTGGLMKFIGDRRRKRDKPITFLATFWGGFGFGFAFSLVRFLMLRFK